MYDLRLGALYIIRLVSICAARSAKEMDARGIELSASLDLRSPKEKV